MPRFNRCLAWLALIVLTVFAAVCKFSDGEYASLVANANGQDADQAEQTSIVTDDDEPRRSTSDDSDTGSDQRRVGEFDDPEERGGRREQADGDVPSGKPAANGKRGTGAKGAGKKATGPSGMPSGGMQGGPGESMRRSMSAGAGGGLPGMSDFGLGKSDSGVYLPNAGAGPKNYVHGKNVGLLLNDAGDKLWGYSVPLGKWTGLTIPKTDKRPVPTVSSDVGLFTVDDRIFAFSSKTGRWDALRTNGRMAVTLHPEQALFEDQGTIHIFSNVTGRWSSAGDPTNVVGDNRQDVTAGDESISRALVDAQGRRIVFDKLDRDGDLDVVVPETSERVSAAELLASLKAQSAEADRDVSQRAAEFRSGAPDQNTLARLRSQLEHSVGEAFDRRQHAQRLEAEILRVKLQRVDSRLLEREQSKGAIISRRVKELIESPSVTVPAPGSSSERPVEKQRASHTSNQRDRGATPEVYATYVPRGTGTRTVGVVSVVDTGGRIVVSPQEPSGIRVGDELEVSRIDFVHEDGTQQYYSFARLFVTQADAHYAVALIIELARTQRDNKYVNEEIAKGDVLGISTFDPGKRPEEANPLLVPLQGRWRCQRWVEDGRVLPPGDLKGSRHTLFVEGDQFTLVDLSAGRILGRTRFQVGKHPNKRNTLPQIYMNALVSVTTSQRNRANVGGIYEVSDKSLRICVGVRSDGLTMNFDAGPNRTHWEFIRDDPQPDNQEENRERR
jgi:hypothetical protein